MTTPPPGWYPDSEQQDQLRYWDGHQWTPHRQPMPHPAPHQGHGQQWTPPGQTTGYGQNAGYAGQPSHDQRPPWEQQAQPSSGRGVIIGLGIGVGLFLILVVVLIVVLISRFGEVQDTAPAQPEHHQENPETLGVGDSVTVHIPEDAETRLHLTVDEAGLYHVATQSEQGTDPVLALQDADGSEVAFADDGGTDSANIMDGGFEVTLAPGDYDVVVTEFSGDPSAVTVSAEQLGVAEEIGDGEHTVEADADTVWLATVEVSDGARVVLDARGYDGADLVLDVVLPDGSTARNDDRSVDDPESGSILDPYLELDLDQGGTVSVMVSGYGSGPVSGTLRVEVDD